MGVVIDSSKKIAFTDVRSQLPLRLETINIQGPFATFQNTLRESIKAMQNGDVQTSHSKFREAVEFLKQNESVLGAFSKSVSSFETVDANYEEFAKWLATESATALKAGEAKPSEPEGRERENKKVWSWPRKR